MASQLDGMSDLLKKLDAIAQPKDNQRVLRAAAGAGMRVVLKEAQATVPVGTKEHKTYKGRLVAPGFASRNLRVVTRINKQTGSAEALLGPRKEAFYATQFIELGTSRIPKRPWLVPAFESKAAAALQALAATMRRRIENLARKRAARAS